MVVVLTHVHAGNIPSGLGGSVIVWEAELAIWGISPGAWGSRVGRDVGLVAGGNALPRAGELGSSSGVEGSGTGDPLPRGGTSDIVGCACSKLGASPGGWGNRAERPVGVVRPRRIPLPEGELPSPGWPWAVGWRIPSRAGRWCISSCVGEGGIPVPWAVQRRDHPLVHGERLAWAVCRLGSRDIPWLVGSTSERRARWDKARNIPSRGGEPRVLNGSVVQRGASPRRGEPLDI